ncbi:MAG TPA: hypothetical protein VMI34_10890 [Candidatus Bathyarchaeia archaeon]|nr:hypothetical protein [Candidatus Bathyarchaeia archaeon]
MGIESFVRDVVAARQREEEHRKGRILLVGIASPGLGDLYRIYVIAQHDGFDFNLTHIGSDFTFEHKEEFDTPYMRALFDYGYNFIRQDRPWLKTPPGLETQLGL